MWPRISGIAGVSLIGLGIWVSPTRPLPLPLESADAIIGQARFPVSEPSTRKTVYINEHGQRALPTVWDGASPFNDEDTARIYLDGKEGIIDRSGQLAFPLRWNEIDSFDSNGRAVATLHGKGEIWDESRDQWRTDHHGIIDSSGRVLIEPIWCTRSDGGDRLVFDDQGMALVQKEISRDKDGLRSGFIDRSGEVIIAPEFDEALPFQGNTSAVRKDKLWGLINRRGEFVITPQWDICAGDPDAGLYRVRKAGEENLTVIGLDGETIVPPQWGWIMNQGNAGHFVVRPGYQKGKIGILDGTGKMISPMIWDEVGSYWGEPPIPVCKDGLWGLLSADGTLISEPQWGELGTFNFHSTAMCSQDGKQGVINQDGSLVVPCIYEEVGYHERWGYRRVKKDGLWGLIDEKGQITEAPRWQSMEDWGHEDHEHGFLVTGQDGRQSIISGQGELRFEIPLGWKNLGRPLFRNLSFVVATTDDSKELVGVIDRNGKPLILPRWDSIRLEEIKEAGESWAAIRCIREPQREPGLLSRSYQWGRAKLGLSPIYPKHQFYSEVRHSSGRIIWKSHRLGHPFLGFVLIVGGALLVSVALWNRWLRHRKRVETLALDLTF